MARAHVQTISQRPKGLMSLSSESDVAWELVECIRSRLTVAELNNAYVNLGIGEFGAVIETLITIVVRERLTVPDELIETMETWRALHHPDGPVSERLTRQLAQCRQHRDSRCGA